MIQEIAHDQSWVLTTCDSRWACGICFYEMLAGRIPFDKAWILAAKGHITRDEYGRFLRKGPSKWPSSAKKHPECLDILQQLLHPDQKRRLGVRDGISEFRTHPFFHKVPFDKVWNRSTKAVPFIMEMPYDWNKRDGTADVFGLPATDRYDLNSILLIFI